MMGIRAFGARLESRIDALQTRERIILSIAGALLMVFLWFQLWGSPLWSKSATQLAQAHSLAQQRMTLAELLDDLEQRLAHDPNLTMRGQYQQLQLQVEQQETELRQNLERLVAPRHMASLLEQLLRQDQGLRVVQLQKLPALPMITAEAIGEAEAPRLYRHGLRLMFEGSFLDTLAYLRRLEGLEQRVLVSRLEFEVLEYPRAQVVLEVETLSLEKSWIGG